jgi:secondary thiamine-phosphate synthase enzyme
LVGLLLIIVFGCFFTQAHIKSALIGASVTIPISNGRLATGTWQGIWYLEFRARKHTRNVVATIQGEKM